VFRLRKLTLAFDFLRETALAEVDFLAEVVDSLLLDALSGDLAFPFTGFELVDEVDFFEGFRIFLIT